MPTTYKHPRDFVQEKILVQNGLSVAETAEILKVPLRTLYRFLSGDTGLTVDLALRIEKAFGIPSEKTLGMQTAYNIKKTRPQVRGLGIRRCRLARSA